MSEEHTKDTKEFNLSDNATKVMEMVEQMTVLELSELVKALEDKFGVSAAAPVMMGAAPAQADDAEAAAEKTSFDVVIKSPGASKVNVIKAIRQIDSSLTLPDAKKLAETPDGVIKKDVKKEEAEEIQSTLQEAGATIELV